MEHKYTSGEYALTPKEYQKIINACNTLEDEVMIKLAVGCGLRRVDITKAKIADIDWVNKRLSFYEHKKSRIWIVPLVRTSYNYYKNMFGRCPKTKKKFLKLKVDKHTIGSKSFVMLPKFQDVRFMLCEQRVSNDAKLLAGHPNKSVH